MQLDRTTLRLKTNLKKSAEDQARRDSTTLQDLFNTALEYYLDQRARKEAKKIVFHSHDLGAPLNNLTRSDFYPQP